MGQYLEALSAALSGRINLSLFVPQHFQGETGQASVHRFVTGRNRRDGLMRLLNPVAAFRIWKAVSSTKPDVVHLFNGEGYPWSLLWARWAEQDGIPLVVTLHDPEPHPGNLWETLNARLRRHVLKRARSVHVHSQVFLEVTKAQGAKEVKVIPHGSLAERFLRYRKEGVEREPLALFLGRLEFYKGLDILVEAGMRLGGRLRVAIAGPGRLPSDLLKLIRSHPQIFELHNRYLEDREVSELFQRASVCVLPYRQVTQSSLPLISAAFGVPVVASALGGFLEDVPRVGGILVLPEDPEALARGMLEAMQRTPRFPPELRFSELASEFVAWYAGIRL
ncbi:glycosyltransferase family 4 protein [Thermus scotoductus]|uniref:Glycosyltransferase n=1 Tax=Thermus scotoductus TaxID=37636 RepID=A0A430VCK8_THESC|nr:glycosyltransferase family 4 protein [Thermus scotoductus]RTG92818.1 glycosyltransferase [Thermus scotoductus]RTH00718.1 glycosyltransferase [Thermus scotoductus]RTH16323.1 glycosyltransferase [Thermus scotoductus]RTH96540.1 glycosyltransferase [Thermus scotoductus]RTI18057.1 glycosyltransferase [Thermus scotoductus]